MSDGTKLSVGLAGASPGARVARRRSAAAGWPPSDGDEPTKGPSRRTERAKLRRPRVRPPARRFRLRRARTTPAGWAHAVPVARADGCRAHQVVHSPSGLTRTRPDCRSMPRARWRGQSLETRRTRSRGSGRTTGCRRPARQSEPGCLRRPGPALHSARFHSSRCLSNSTTSGSPLNLRSTPRSPTGWSELPGGSPGPDFPQLRHAGSEWPTA